VKALVCTMGAKGSVIFADGKRHEIRSVEAEKVVDPTGCGDAYRAGLPTHFPRLGLAQHRS